MKKLSILLIVLLLCIMACGCTKKYVDVSSDGSASSNTENSTIYGGGDDGEVEFADPQNSKPTVTSKNPSSSSSSSTSSSGSKPSGGSVSTSSTTPKDPFDDKDNWITVSFPTTTK